MSDFRARMAEPIRRGLPPLRRAARAFHAAIVHPALDALLPSDCFGCGVALPAAHHLGACPACWASLEPLLGPACPTCATPTPRSTDLAGAAGGRCSACVVAPPAPDAALALVAYDRLARRFLLRAKAGGRREILDALGARLGRRVALAGFAERCSIVIPVPSHPWTRFRRGFNPALELARAVAAATSLPLAPGALARDWRRLEPAKGLGRSARREAVRDAFQTRGRWPSARVLLVDDVLTTGATAAACVAALRGAGALEVRLAVWARTPRERPLV